MEEEKNKDLVFNVMPQGGTEPIGNPVPSAQPESATIGSQVGAATSSAPVNWSTGPSKTRKALYIVTGVIVLLALGGLAYYMLGIKKTDTPQEDVATTRLPKVWLQQYFSVDTCLDQTTCSETVDADNDGLDNYSEFKAATNPLNPDTDIDGLADGDEINIYKTEAVLKYTDRREIVATNNWTDGVQIKGGFDPLTPGLKFTDVRKQQIAADILKFKLHEPSISTTTTAPPPPPTPSTAIPADWKTYANAQYGFEFKYPGNWTLASTKEIVSTDGRITNLAVFANRLFSIPEKNDILVGASTWDIPKDVKLHTGTEASMAFTDWFDTYYKKIASDSPAQTISNVEISANPILEKKSYLETWQEHFKVGSQPDKINKQLVVDIGNNKALVIQSYSALSNSTEFTSTSNSIFSTFKFTQ